VNKFEAAFKLFADYNGDKYKVNGTIKIQLLVLKYRDLRYHE